MNMIFRRRPKRPRAALYTQRVFRIYVENKNKNRFCFHLERGMPASLEETSPVERPTRSSFRVSGETRTDIVGSRCNSTKETKGKTKQKKQMPTRFCSRRLPSTRLILFRRVEDGLLAFSFLFSTFRFFFWVGRE